MDVPDRPGGPRVLRPRPVLTWSLDALTTPRRRPHRPSAAPTVSRAGTTGRGPGWEPVPGGAHVRESPLRLAPAPVSSPRCAARATHHERREDNATFVEACGLHDSARTLDRRADGVVAGRLPSPAPPSRRKAEYFLAFAGVAAGPRPLPAPRAAEVTQRLSHYGTFQAEMTGCPSSAARKPRVPGCGWPSSRAADASRPSQRTVSTRAR